MSDMTSARSTASLIALLDGISDLPSRRAGLREGLRRRVGTLTQYAPVVPFGPEMEDRVLYRYKLYNTDGSDAGEAEYAVWIKPGELIHGRDGRKLRVVDVVPVLEAEARYVGLLMVEPA